MGDHRESGLEDLDRWLNQFLEDPFAVYAGGIRTDVFETSGSYYIEADLRDCPPADMTITAEDCCLIVETAGRKAQVFLPFTLEKRKIQAAYSSHILEISISKEETEPFGHPAAFTIHPDGMEGK
ncbi:Hsp20/alpha crystallin family protein [Bacillus mangrovi]|uniref:Hsp20/alpha crystallin family protein n=1 Tax=Metabacillus mangrovi TaxID=1491830 RepID=A0A7X2V3B2_9BACI|nr:Hsp20/alpha crystallin family protein [Metabacillus mangrovi]MTH51838.1 Hsp20/alpha crystallin family protein [Metabacillus mangrovi]